MKTAREGVPLAPTIRSPIAMVPPKRLLHIGNGLDLMTIL